MNRIATEADRIIYGSYITVGDLILDTPTNNKNLTYYFMGDTFHELKDNVTFWFDGDKLGILDAIKFQNTSKELPWRISSVRFKNIPGTKVKTKGLSCKGLKYFSLDGLDNTFTGIGYWPVTRKFLTGNFGFHSIQTDGGHGYDISVLNGGGIAMRGFEAQGGFAGLRIQSKGDSTLSSLFIEEFYIHDTKTGEGQYIGSTQSAPTPKFKNVTIRNGIVARSAAEALQLQHMAGSNVYNITIYAADTGWINSFQNYQATGIQFNVAEGINKLHHILVDGYCNPGFNPFSVSPIDFKAEEINETHIHDLLLFDGRGAGTYMNQSMSNGVKWNFNNVYYGGFNSTFYEYTGNNIRPLISSGRITDEVVFNKLYHDGSKQPLFDKQYKINQLIEQPILAPVYRNSGFYEPASYIMQWDSVYASYFDGPNDTPTHWKVGIIAIDDFKFYKCLTEHTATTVRPADNSNFLRLTWDENGIRSDQGDWIPSTQSDIPPDDLRQTPYSTWNHLGIQIKEKIVEEYYLNGKRITITDSGTIY